jgi:hypothetical protein
MIQGPAARFVVGIKQSGHEPLIQDARDCRAWFSHQDQPIRQTRRLVTGVAVIY